jgi:hypothetical protein
VTAEGAGVGVIGQAPQLYAHVRARVKPLIVGGERKDLYRVSVAS